jgi:FxsC-like protein
MPFWFFTSYARADRDPYLDRFLNDLRNEVRNIVGGLIDETGFVDTQNIEAAEEWEPALAAALQASRVCVSLCSQSYLNSTYCGKEYQVFLQRREKSVRRTSSGPNRLIFPVLWSRPNQPIPEAISRFQLTHADFPELYATEGLRYIMQLTKFQDDYQQFLSRLTRKIVEAGNEIGVSPLDELPRLKEVQSAFHEPQPEARHGGMSTLLADPDSARFVFFVGCREELRKHRKSVGGYHDTSGWYWRPYYPHDDAAVGLLAQEVASKLKLRYFELGLHVDIVDEIRKLENMGQVVVLLADAWSMRVPRCAIPLQQYDQAMFANCAVLVPWNDSDPETNQSRELLEQALRNVLPRKTQMCPPLHHWDTIRCGKDLREQLEKVLTEARMTVLKIAGAQRKAESTELSQIAEQQGIIVDRKPELDSTERVRRD